MTVSIVFGTREVSSPASSTRGRRCGEQQVVVCVASVARAFRIGPSLVVAFVSAWLAACAPAAFRADVASFLEDDEPVALRAVAWLLAILPSYQGA